MESHRKSMSQQMTPCFSTADATIADSILQDGKANIILKDGYTFVRV